MADFAAEPHPTVPGAMLVTEVRSIDRVELRCSRKCDIRGIIRHARWENGRLVVELERRLGNLAGTMRVR